MAAYDPRSNVVKFNRLTPAAAQQRVRSISKDSEAVIVTDHAAERMEQRGFTMRDLFRILRTGFVDEAPEEIREGDWKCKVTQKIGSREAGAVTIIMRERRLIVKTVEWEDVR